MPSEYGVKASDYSWFDPKIHFLKKDVNKAFLCRHGIGTTIQDFKRFLSVYLASHRKEIRFPQVGNYAPGGNMKLAVVYNIHDVKRALAARPVTNQLAFDFSKL